MESSSVLSERLLDEIGCLLRATAIQGCLPVILQLPPIIAINLSVNLDVEVKLFRLLFGLFIVNALIDPIVVLWIVKPYRNAFLSLLKGLRTCSFTVVQSLEGKNEELNMQERSEQLMDSADHKRTSD